MKLYDYQFAKFLGQTNPITKPYFRGVYTIDADQLGIAEQACDLNDANILMINTNKSNSAGQHWVGCYIYPEKPNLCAFIDPLANDPSYYSPTLQQFLDFMMSSYHKLTYPIQDIRRNNDSGLFSCFLLHYCCVGKSIDFACTHFFKPQKYGENNAVLFEWYKTMFNTNSILSLFPVK